MDRQRGTDLYHISAKQKLGVPDGTIIRPYPPGDNSFSVLNALFQDAFQSLYHVVRMELGVILENQIYASSEMYNRTIASVNIRGFTPGTVTPLVNTSALATDADLLSQGVEAVRMFNSTDRVPVMFYLRPVPRLKPLGSAITSVFVSTFAMLSTLWTIFNIIAAALAKAKAKTGDLAETPDDETIFHSGARMGRRLRDKLGGPDATNWRSEWDTSEAAQVTKSPEPTTLEGLSFIVKKNSTQMSIAMAEMQI
ncbi:hypothetical protein DFH09DRAFT_1391487 [Mycena vulgaris]|nr:hypothetical protein DFH09DRAFT_1391487 [Mycena vulgaris]